MIVIMTENVRKLIKDIKLLKCLVSFPSDRKISLDILYLGLK